MIDLERLALFKWSCIWMTSILISTCFYSYALNLLIIRSVFPLFQGVNIVTSCQSQPNTTPGKDGNRCLKMSAWCGGGPRVCKQVKTSVNLQQFWWCCSSTEWFVGYTEIQARPCCRSTAWECDLLASWVTPSLGVLLLLLLLLFLPHTWKGHFTVAARKYWS